MRLIGSAGIVLNAPPVAADDAPGWLTEAAYRER